MNWLKKLLQASTLFAPPSLSNNKVLLISNAERGQANVFIATSQSLLKHHPGIDIHFASFPELPAAVGAVSSSITFHPLNGSSYLDSLIREGFRIADLPHPPGAFGAVRALSSAPTLFVPWNGPEYVTVFNDILKVIGQVDPGLVVVDLLLPPAHDAVRELDMTYAVMAPNSIKDIAVVDQPWGRAFWKFPMYLSHSIWLCWIVKAH